MRLIDADVLKSHIDKLPALPDGNFAGNHSALKALINMQPTVERPKGKWIPAFDGKFTGGAYWYNCNQCNHIVPGGLQSEKYFCENCGADMREEKANENNI